MVIQGKNGSVVFYFENRIVGSLPLGNHTMEDYEKQRDNLIREALEEKDKLKEKIELLEKEKEELIEECKEKNKWNEKLQEHHDRSNERMQIYMGYLHDMETAINNLRLSDEEILKSYK